MNGMNTLPPIPKPPHDPTSLLLNSRTGWRAMEGGLQQAEITPTRGALALAPLPGSGRAMTEPSGSFGGLTVPGNMAVGPDGSLYLLDARSLELKRFDPCECAFRTVPCFGGEGGGGRQLRNPHGIGICGGDLFVCDTGASAGAAGACDDPERVNRRIQRENHRLSVFSLRGFALRGHWRPPPSAYAAAGGPLANPWEPYGVAFDGRGRVYVSDPANGCVHRFHPGGRWETCLPGFGVVSWIALDCRDRLYAVVAGLEPAVRVTDTEGNPIGTETRPDTLAPLFPRPPFETDANGHLHLGPFCADAGADGDACAPPGGRPAPERGVFDLHGEPVPDPPPPLPPAYPKEGVYISAALDSELYRCQWHRVILRGEMPSGARVVVSTFTSEAALADDQVLGLPEDRWETRQTAFAMEDGAWDGLVRSGGGRYLWLRLQLRGNGKTTPLLDSAVVEFPRVSLRRYLPAVFGAEPVSADFTDRFLGLFDTTLRSVERKVDRLAGYFDPLSTPAEPDPKTGLDFLTWLASWIGLTLDRRWPEAKRRAFLKNAGKLYDLRGTREGLRRQLLLFLEIDAERCCCPDDQPKTRCRPAPPNCAPVVIKPCAWETPPLILEHYRLRRWLFVGAGRLGDEAVLWGRRIVNRSQLDEGAQAGQTQLITTQDPHRDPFHVYAHKFTVFVPACYGRAEGTRRSLESLLKAESPAHTQYRVEYVEPRFRIGFQSMIGLDTVIGRLPQDGVTLGETPLGPASVLTSPPNEQGGPSFEVGESRIGTTTRLD